jgi:hypothetical protein
MKSLFNKVVEVGNKANPMNLISKAGEVAGDIVVKKTVAVKDKVTG